MKLKIINLAISLAIQESSRTGKDYTECISWACDEACIRLEVSRKEFIKIFL